MIKDAVIQKRLASPVMLLHGNTNDIFPTKKGNYTYFAEYLKTQLKHDQWHEIDLSTFDIEQEFQDAITCLFQQDQRVVIHIKSAAVLLPEGQALFQTLHMNVFNNIIKVLQSAQKLHHKSTVFISTTQQQKLYQPLLDEENNIQKIEIPLPDIQQRAAFLRFLEKKYPKKGRQWYLHYDVQKQEILAATQGLSLVQMHRAVTQAALHAQPLTKKILLQMQKAAIQESCNGLLEFITPQCKLSDIAGMHAVSNRLEQLAQLLRYKPQLCPKGLLFVGAPGTGKTVCAEALATQAGVHFVTMKAIRSKWVGESEANMQKMCQTLEIFAPIIVFMDEFDQGSSARGGHEVDQRILAQLLSFMAKESNRGRILWIAATNRPDLIDPALKRAGRLEDTIYFPRPDQEGRKRILQSVLAQHKVLLSADQIPGIESHFSGADIYACAMNALQLAEATGEQCNASHIKEVLQSKLPSANTEQLQEMDDLALKEVSDRRYLNAEQIQRREELV